MTKFQKCQRAVLQGIARFLPDNTKRIVLWSTLYSKMCSAREVPSENTARLNQIMGLAKTVEATKLPIKMGDVIWKDLDQCSDAVSDAVLGKSLEDCAKRFVQSIPMFLRYASERYITEDFIRLVTAHKRPQGAAA